MMKLGKLEFETCDLMHCHFQPDITAKIFGGSGLTFRYAICTVTLAYTYGDPVPNLHEPNSGNLKVMQCKIVTIISQNKLLHIYGHGKSQLALLTDS